MNGIKDIFTRIAETKKIAAVKTPKHIDLVLKLREQIGSVFLLTGNINVIKHYVEVLIEAGLPTFVHIEKIKGLSNDSDGLDFIANYVRPTGIVTTKPSLIASAKKRQLLTVQRIFMIDSEILVNLPVQLERNKPDIIEIMPARIPEILAEIKTFTKDVPIITGGLLTEKEHAEAALAHGALAVSTSNRDVWKADLAGAVAYS